MRRTDEACDPCTRRCTGRMPVAPARNVAVSEESLNMACAQHEGLRRSGCVSDAVCGQVFTLAI